MPFLRSFLLSLMAAFSLGGCIQMERLVKVAPDGSGTIEETVLLSKAAVASFQQMAAGIGANKAGAAVAPQIFDEAKLKAAAAKMGDGVTLLSAHKISNEQGEGFAATYAFTDINKLTIDQNPGDTLPAGGDPRPSPKKEPIAFHFTKGTPAELSITMPPADFKPSKHAPAEMDDLIIQTMKQMLKDMRLSMAVEVEGAVQESNAAFRDGSRITLMDLDFNKLLADPVKLKAITKANPQSLQEAKTLLKGLDGVKIETAPEVKIKFQ